jgi:hypothetical protein
MTRDDIIRMAREADLDWHKHWDDDESNRLERFAVIVSAAKEQELLANIRHHIVQAEERGAAAEREACAKVCEQQKDRWVDGSDQWGNPCPARLRATPSSCAAAIRARN